MAASLLQLGQLVAEVVAEVGEGVHRPDGHGGHTGGDGEGDNEGGGEDTSLLGSQADNDLNTTRCPQLVFTTSAASGPGGRRPYRCALLEQTGTNKHTNIFCSFLYCYRRRP